MGDLAIPELVPSNGNRRSRAAAWLAKLTSSGLFGCFPTLIAAGFFYMLIKRNEVMYAPGDFNENTTVKAYVEAMRTSRLGLESITAEFGQVLRETATAIEEDDVAIDKAVELGMAQISDRLIRIDVRNLVGPSAEPVSYVPRSDSTVQEFLDYVFFGLEGTVDAFTYGSDWVLATEDGKRIEKRETGSGLDHRPISSVGLKPGVMLKAELLPTAPDGGGRRSVTTNRRGRFTIDVARSTRSGTKGSDRPPVGS